MAKKHDQIERVREAGSPDRDVARMDEAARDAIEKRAYELYLHREADDGDALRDWLQAERELRAGRDE